MPLMDLLSYMGSTDFGGTGMLSGGWDMAAVVVAALVFYYWGVAAGRRTRYLDERDQGEF